MIVMIVFDVALQVGKASIWLWDNMGQLHPLAFRGLDGTFTSNVVPSEGKWGDADVETGMNCIGDCSHTPVHATLAVP